MSRQVAELAQHFNEVSMDAGLAGDVVKRTQGYFHILPHKSFPVRRRLRFQGSYEHDELPPPLLL